MSKNLKVAIITIIVLTTICIPFREGIFNIFKAILGI